MVSVDGKCVSQVASWGGTVVVDDDLEKLSWGPGISGWGKMGKEVANGGSEG